MAPHRLQLQKFGFPPSLLNEGVKNNSQTAWPHIFLRVLHLPILKPQAISFLGLYLNFIMASSIPSVEDRNTPEHLSFFGRRYLEVINSVVP